MQSETYDLHRSRNSWIFMTESFYVVTFLRVLLIFCFRLTLSLNIYCIAINYTSATFAAASTNTIPAITFIIAVCLR